jgi:tetratricopeptide (TPR) repeat protein
MEKSVPQILHDLHCLEDYEGMLEVAYKAKRQSSEKWDSITDYYIAIAEHGLGNTSYAIHLLKGFASNPEISAQSIKYLGNIYGELGDYQTSLYYFDLCADYCWGEIDFLVNYACNHYELGNKERALDLFQTAKIIHPQFDYLDHYIKKILTELGH